MFDIQILQTQSRWELSVKMFYYLFISVSPTPACAHISNRPNVRYYYYEAYPIATLRFLQRHVLIILSNHHGGVIEITLIINTANKD